MKNALLSLTLAAGCASPAREPPPTPSAVEAPPPLAPSSRPWEGGREVASNAGTWRVVYRQDADAIPRGETFGLDAWVFDATGTDAPREDVALAVDAAMPQHGHGMNRVSRVLALEGGRFRVEGLFFHMPGRWELYFDITHGPRTERAQVAVDLE